jgi:hypothetical protein
VDALFHNGHAIPTVLGEDVARIQLCASGLSLSRQSIETDRRDTNAGGQRAATAACPLRNRHTGLISGLISDDAVPRNPRMVPDSPRRRDTVTSFAPPALAHVATIDLDRMVDDGGPPLPATPATVPGRVRQMHATPGDDAPISDWYWQLGGTHRRRDESAGRESRARQDRQQEQEHAARVRWPDIVAAVRTNVRRYNLGAGLQWLTVIDDAGESGVSIATVVARSGQTLTITKSGADLCVRPSPITVGAADGGRRWITLEATDEAIADYALQDWLTHL